MLTPIEQHYAKHKEDLRLLRRHGQVEFAVTMWQIERWLERTRPSVPAPSEGGSGSSSILDIGAGTGRYASALTDRGYHVQCIELVQHNIDVMLQRDPRLNARRGDARSIPWVPDASQDLVLLLGPLYHLTNDNDKVDALREARRVLRPGGIIMAAYLMNDYSILTYCFDENRMEELMAKGLVDGNFHVCTHEGELYDYVRQEDIDRFNALAGLRSVCRFSPEGAADFMRTPLNRMSERTFQLFIEYQKTICERPDLLGAGSHIVDVLSL